MEASEQDLTIESGCSWPSGCVPIGVTVDGHVFGLWPRGSERTQFVWDGAAGEPFDETMAMKDGA
ncbi:MAG TPA: hypothetical protein VF902_07585 [Coriobacteriia bacterium]